MLCVPIQIAEYGSLQQDLTISGAEKAQILGAGVQNSCQVWIMSELRGKSNKICVKGMKIRALGAD